MSDSTEIDLPLRFEDDGNVALVDLERAIHNNLLSSVFLQQKGIPLRPNIGSQVPMHMFDPTDELTKELVIASARDSIRKNEPRVKLGSIVTLTIDSDGNATGLRFDYSYRNSNMGWQKADIDGEKIR